jgi:sRNA-binding regulator protein Hfq
MTTERDLKSIHQRIKDQKAKRKNLKEIVKNELTANKAYQDLLEEIAKLKEKKVKMESDAKVRLQTELQEIDKLTVSIKADEQMMSDIALSKYVKGETVELKDEQDTEYVPEFKVRFKKK